MTNLFLLLLIILLVLILSIEINKVERFLYPPIPDSNNYTDPQVNTINPRQNRDLNSPNPYILNNKIDNTLKTMSCYNSRDYEPAIKSDGSYTCPTESQKSKYPPNSPGQYIPCETNEDCHGFYSQLCLNNNCVQPFMGMNDFKNLPPNIIVLHQSVLNPILK